MNDINDPDFGKLSYEYGWVGSFAYEIFEEMHKIRLFIPCDSDAPIEQKQRQAFRNFQSIKNNLSHQIEAAIYSYYNSVVGEYRDRLGNEFADKMAPILSQPSQIADLVTPTEIMLQQAFDSTDRIVGLLFDCTWEPELGLAVKIVNENIEEVGIQDIVL